MPSFANVSNSEIVALVTGDPTKAEELAKQYKIDKKNTYSYEEFDKFLSDKVADAIYLATPNWRHEEFAIPALKAGVHVLLEKPMEVTAEKCERILKAHQESSAKLMIAYRMHFEPATIAAIEKVRSGELGEVHMFTSTFTQPLDPNNHRGQSGWKAGPLLDIGIYPLNAVRNLYGTEPLEVFAFGTRHPEAGFSNDFDDTVSVTLVFPQNRLAQFTVSYYGNLLDEYTIAGTKGSIHVSPAFMYEAPLEFAPICIGEKNEHKKFPYTNHFGGEMEYFSECILKNTEPEPDGREGLADVRVLDAILRSLETKLPVKLDTATQPTTNKITTAQEKQVGGPKRPSADELVNAAPPAAAK
jgi:predicted dehydrogenase